MKPCSEDGGRKEGGSRVWHGPLAPVFVHRAAQRGLCIVRHTGTHTHIAPLAVDSAGLIVIIPFSCLPSSAAHIFANSHSHVLSFPHVFRCLSPLISAPPSLLSSLRCLSLHSWLNYLWWFIVPNGQCTADTEGFISLGPSVR